MDKKDMARILAILQTNYQKKIDNTEATVGVWLMTLQDFSAEAVLQSARLHMAKSKYFPTPAEIRENIVRRRIVLTEPTAPRLGEGKRAKVTVIPDGMSEADFLDLFWSEQVRWEEQFLDYEK